MIDKLIDKILKLDNPTVVGLDPTFEMMPEFLKREKIETFGKTTKAVSEIFLSFNREIIDYIYDVVPAIKLQIAMYEKYGAEGISAYIETISYAKEKGLLVIGDIKRGDIGSTAEAYAGHLSGVNIEGQWIDTWKEDAVTVNPYLGSDGMQPFIEACISHSKSIFVLVKTSNQSSEELQDLKIEGRCITFYEEVARLVTAWGAQAMGERGYSQIGAVVGATHKAQGIALREQMPNTFFLVPGYGAQGGAGEDLKGFFDSDGIGCIVNSSRGITGAYKKNVGFGEKKFGEAARNAVIRMKEDLKNAK